jgi:hypothetical protein
VTASDGQQGVAAVLDHPRDHGDLRPARGGFKPGGEREPSAGLEARCKRAVKLGGRHPRHCTQHEQPGVIATADELGRQQAQPQGDQAAQHHGGRNHRRAADQPPQGGGGAGTVAAVHGRGEHGQKAGAGAQRHEAARQQRALHEHPDAELPRPQPMQQQRREHELRRHDGQ